MSGERRANGKGTVFQLSDGKWVAKIYLGQGPHGEWQVKQFSGKTEAIVKKKLRDYKCSTDFIERHAPVTVADLDAIAPGMTTIAIGNPAADELGGLSVTSGIVSVDSEYITMTAGDSSGEVSFRVIRTDAPVNPGNSGGGMYSDKGELVGIVNAKIADSDIENIGYALPSNVVRAVADNIIDYCHGTDCESVMRGLLGITIQTTGYSTAYDAELGLLLRREEISVYEVTAGGLGENILKADDVVKSITIGETTITVTRQHHLIDAMLDVRVGDTVTLSIVRDGQEMTVSTIITEDCLSAY